MRRWHALAGIAAASLVAGGAALATGHAGIPGDDGIIHGCYQNGQGMLRVVASGDECRPSERAIMWNEQGEDGAAGLQGAAGPQGEIGPQGAVGPEGRPGATGADGAAGAAGPVGPAGPQGESGPQGQTGADGSDGAPGADGAQGATGAPGPQGLQGPEGPGGVTGYDVVSVQSASTSTNKTVIADCPDGKRVLGGGVDFSLESESLVVVSSRPSGFVSGWTVAVRETEPTDSPWSVFVYAICADVD